MHLLGLAQEAGMPVVVCASSPSVTVTAVRGCLQVEFDYAQYADIRWAAYYRFRDRYVAEASQWFQSGGPREEGTDS